MAVKTYDRIISESLALFNEQGERNITTNHIAAHLGISPGNLYYHFRNKEEIVYKIFCQYQAYMREHMRLPSERELEVEDLAHYLDAAFNAMWQYRFLFYDLPGLLARDPQLQQDYQTWVAQEMAPQMAQAFAEFGRVGFLSASTADLTNLATNVWLIVKFWFAFEQTIHPHTPISEKTRHAGARQVLSLLKPHVNPLFTTEFALIEARYQST